VNLRVFPADVKVAALLAAQVAVNKMINKKRLIKLTQALIRIPSENPPGDEYKVARFIKDYLSVYKIKTKLYEFQKKRTNLLAYMGQKKKPVLVITPHLDTVPAGKNWRYPAFSGKMLQGKIYGRGATDDKGNLAIALEAMTSIAEEKVKLNYQLVLVASADEENGSKLGVIPLLERRIIKPNFTLILDNAGFDILLCQKGLLHLKISIFGKKAHGAYPWLGENAIEKAVYILKEIKEHKFKYTPHPLLKPPTINFGTIQGGERVNMVSDWCQFSLDIRFLPGISVDLILRDIKNIVKKHARKFKIEIIAKQSPFQTEQDNPLLIYLKRALKKNKCPILLKGSEGATTITFFSEKKIPAVGFGVGEKKLSHASDECIKIADLYRGAKVLEDFLKSFYSV